MGSPNVTLVSKTTLLILVRPFTPKWRTRLFQSSLTTVPPVYPCGRRSERALSYIVRLSERKLARCSVSTSLTMLIQFCSLKVAEQNTIKHTRSAIIAHQTPSCGLWRTILGPELRLKKNTFFCDFASLFTAKGGTLGCLTRQTACTCSSARHLLRMSVCVRLTISSVCSGSRADLGMRLMNIWSSVKPSPDSASASATAEPIDAP